MLINLKKVFFIINNFIILKKSILKFKKIVNLNILELLIIF